MKGVFRGCTKVHPSLYVLVIRKVSLKNETFYSSHTVVWKNNARPV